MWAIVATHWQKGRKFETSSTKDMRYFRENWLAFTRLKFQQDNLVIKGLTQLLAVLYHHMYRLLESLLCETLFCSEKYAEHLQ